MPLLLALWLVAAPLPPAPGQRICVEAVDISAESPLLWRPNLEIEELASEQFAREKAFPLAAAPENADFIFLVLYDIHSNDHAEAGVLLSRSDYAKGAQSLADLRREALWFGMDRGHFGLKFLRQHSATRNLVHDFCLAFRPRRR